MSIRRVRTTYSGIARTASSGQDYIGPAIGSCHPELMYPHENNSLTAVPQVDGTYAALTHRPYSTARASKRPASFTQRISSQGEKPRHFYANNKLFSR